MLAEFLSDLRYRVRALFSRHNVEQELDEEFQFHLHREAEKLMRGGMGAEEARRQARVAFGGVESMKEASRDGWGIVLLEIIGQDLRYAVRSLRRDPGFTFGVILTIGLGIGVNAAMFGIVDRLLFRTPAYLQKPDQVHRVYLAWDDRGQQEISNSTEYTRYLDLRRWTTDFSLMGGFSTRSLPVGVGTEAREMQVSTMSATIFDFFDAKPVLGRFFVAEEDTVPIGALVAVLGYGFWQTQYGGRPEVLGQQLRIGTASYTIIGVAPPGFVGIADEGPPVAFVPITAYAGTFRAGPAQSNYYTRYNWGWMNVLARRKPGVSMTEASADLSHAYLQSWNYEVSQGWAHTPSEVAHPSALAGPVQVERGPLQSKVTRVAAWVSAVAVIVLLIACANVANLLLARSVRRRREIAVRLALGVSRRRLIGQMLTESLLLAACGGVAGVLLGHWGGIILRRLLMPDATVNQALADGRTLVVALALVIVAAALTAIAPMLQVRRTDLTASLKAGAREGGYHRSPTRTALLLLQGALSVVLLVGAGLFVQSLRHVQGLRLGYDVDPVLYISPNHRGAKLSDAEATVLRQRLLESARALPGIESAALGLTVPFWDTWTQSLYVAGIDSVSRLGSFTLQAGSPEYFKTLGTRILRGRGISAEDQKEAPLVAMVSETMAKTLWPGQEAVGKCMRMDSDTMPCVTIVGITEDIKQNSITDDPGLQYYLPISQYHPEAAVIFARVRGEADDQKESVRRQLQPLMPGDGYLTVSAMSDIVGPNVRSWQLGAGMFLAFGGLALFLAAIGLYSVIAYDVAQRTRELGVRIALGAQVPDVVKLVVEDGLRFALAGMAIGGIIALWTGRWIEPLLYAQSPRDPLVFGVVTGVLLTVAAVASAVPAFRAAQVNPNVALREE